MAVDRVWRPGPRAAAGWTALGFLALAGGLALFSAPVLLRTGGFSVSIGVGDIAITLALVLALVVAHEGIHAAVMRAFGARPRFGFVVVAKVMPAFYAAAPGHRFTRGQYLAAVLAPMVLVSSAGFGSCFTALAAYLVVPLAVHLAGCAGDAALAWQALHEPKGTMCEDLLDGVRFTRSAAGIRTA